MSGKVTAKRMDAPALFETYPLFHLVIDAPGLGTAQGAVFGSDYGFQRSSLLNLKWQAGAA